MKIPGVTTILLYQFTTKKMKIEKNIVKLVEPFDSKNNNWVFEYFPEDICAKRWQEHNQLFYLLNKEKQPCSFAWQRIGKEHFIGEINRKLIFKNNVNCIFDCITPEKYRRKGYYPSLINQLSMIGNEHPSIIYASSTNVASNKGIIKGGFELTHKFFRIFNWIKTANMNNSEIEFDVRKAS